MDKTDELEPPLLDWMIMPGCTFRVLTRTDGEVARLVIDRAGKTVADVELSAAEIDDVIARLASSRVAMGDAGSQGGGAPQAHFVKTPWPGGPQLVAWQHPTVGWIAFGLSSEQARSLQGTLGKELPSKT